MVILARMVAQGADAVGLAAYRVVFAHSSDGVLLHTVDGRVHAANPAACTMLDLSQAQICGRPFDGPDGLVDQEDPRWALAVAERRRSGVSTGAVRMHSGAGRFVELELTTRVFRAEDGSEQLCSTLHDATGRKALERSMEELSARLFQLSRVDDLTGFQNRRGLIGPGTQLVQLADRTAAPLQVLFVEVRNVAHLNERLGHDAGDAALQAVARALSVTFRRGDVLARVGGTSFLALAAGISAGQLDALVGCVREHLDAPDTTAFVGAPVEVSFGWTTRHPGEATSLEELIRRADRATSVVR